MCAYIVQFKMMKNRERNPYLVRIGRQWLSDQSPDGTFLALPSQFPSPPGPPAAGEGHQPCPRQLPGAAAPRGIRRGKMSSI